MNITDLTVHELKDKLNNKELTEMPDVEEGINFFFEDVFIPNTKVILDLKLDTLSIDDKVLSKDINLNIIGNKKICIIGKNGSRQIYFS